MNLCIFTGNLVEDVKLEALPNSESFVASGTIAVNDYKSSKENDVDFIRFRVYGKDRASFLAERTTKGCKITITGVLKNNKYEKDGVKKEYSYLRANDYEIITWKQEEGSIFDDAKVVSLT